MKLYLERIEKVITDTKIEKKEKESEKLKGSFRVGTDIDLQIPEEPTSTFRLITIFFTVFI